MILLLMQYRYNTIFFVNVVAPAHSSLFIRNHIIGGLPVLKFGLGPTPAITVLQCNCNFVIVHRKYVNKEFRKLSTIVNIVDFSHDI